MKSVRNNGSGNYSHPIRQKFADTKYRICLGEREYYRAKLLKENPNIPHKLLEEKVNYQLKTRGIWKSYDEKQYEKLITFLDACEDREFDKAVNGLAKEAAIVSKSTRQLKLKSRKGVIRRSKLLAQKIAGLSRNYGIPLQQVIYNNPINNIVTIPLSLSCADCGHIFEVQKGHNKNSCPLCASRNLKKHLRLCVDVHDGVTFEDIKGALATANLRLLSADSDTLEVLAMMPMNEGDTRMLLDAQGKDFLEALKVIMYGKATGRLGSNFERDRLFYHLVKERKIPPRKLVKSISNIYELRKKLEDMGFKVPSIRELKTADIREYNSVIKMENAKIRAAVQRHGKLRRAITAK